MWTVKFSHAYVCMLMRNHKINWFHGKTEKKKREEENEQVATVIFVKPFDVPNEDYVECTLYIYCK